MHLKFKVNALRKKGIAKLLTSCFQIHQLTCLFLKMNMFGLGNLMMRYVMKKKNVDTLPSL